MAYNPSTIATMLTSAMARTLEVRLPVFSNGNPPFRRNGSLEVFRFSKHILFPRLQYPRNPQCSAIDER